MQVPWSGSVTLATATTIYNLKTLITSATPPFTITNARKVRVGVQNGPTNGGTLVFIGPGNNAVSATNFGAYLYVGGLWTESFETIDALGQVYLTASADSALLGLQVTVESYV